MNNIGQNWLLLRGLARESGHWGDFVSRLQREFPQATINTLDLPGTGGFNNLPSPNSIEDIVKFTREQVLQAGFLNQPVTLFALSLGGMVAWDWMKQYPQDISASILVNTSLASISPFYQRLRWQSYGQFIRVLLAKSILAREMAIIRLVSNQNDKNRLIIAKDWAAICEQRPISFLNSFLQIWAAARYKPDNQLVEQKVLLLNSFGDRLVSPTCTIALQKKFQLSIESHLTAGHDLPLDQPDWVIEKLVFFISKKTV